jgi:hypothetical protein
LEGSGVDAGAAAAPFAPSEPDEPVEELEEAVCVAAPAMIEEASSGEIVVVSVLDGEPFVPVERTIEPSISDALSTKKIAGPATCLEVSRSTTLLMRGLLSLVIQRATGPLIPGGTTHCARGMLTANGAPPVIMLQKRFCGKKNELHKSFLLMRKHTSVPVMFAAETVNVVPWEIGPVLVTVRGLVAARELISRKTREKRK